MNPNHNQYVEAQRVAVFSILLLVFLLVSLVGFIPFSPRNVLMDAQSTGSGNLIRQLLYIVLFGLSLLFVAISQKRMAVMALPWPVLLVFLWALFSLIWSAVPGIGFRRLVLTFIVSATLYNLVLSLGIEKAFKVFLGVVVGCTLVSLLAGLVIPAAIHQPNDRELAVVGDWRGIFVHKNNAGLIAAIAFMLSLHQFEFTRQKVWGVITFFVFIMLLLTGSKTSLILCIPVLSVAYFTRYYLMSKQRDVKALMAASMSMAMLFVLGLVLLNWELSEDVLSDPTSFTGRVGIWDVMVQVIAENPLFGHGFGSLFSVGAASPLASYTTDYAFEWIYGIAHAHNGYLELIASVGLIGFAIVIYAFLIQPLKTFLTLPTKYTAAYIVPVVSTIGFLVLHNTFETSLFNGSRQGWIIWFFVVSFIYSFNRQFQATLLKFK